jgi:hypothetical protein
MFPCFPIFYKTHNRMCDAICVSYYSLGSIISAYLAYLVIGKFGNFAIDPLWSVPSTLYNTILGVVRTSSYKEVVGICTGWGVASVKYPHTGRNRTIVKFPRYMVSILNNSLNPKLSILGGVRSPNPQPTPRHWFKAYAFVKSFLNCFCGILTLKHVNPPTRVDVSRAWEKLTLLLCPSYYNTKQLGVQL